MATPTLVQHIASANTEGMTAISTQANIPLLYPSVAGNFLMLAIFGTNGAAELVNSVTDDQSQTWTKAVAFETGTNANGWIFTQPGTAANVKNLTVKFNTTDDSQIRYALSEWYNVSTSGIHQSWVNEGTVASTNWASSGNQTPSNGDLVYQAAIAGTPPFNSATPFVAGSGFSLECADMMQGGLVAQSLVSAGAAVNPTVVAGLSAPWVSLAVSLASATKGGDNANSFRVKRAQSSVLHNGISSAPKFQSPADGNLQILVHSNTNSSNITAATGYVHTSASPLGNGATVAMVAHMYAVTTSAPDRTRNGTITLNTTNGDGPFWFLDVIGASTAPLDRAIGSTGNQAAAGNLTINTVTPTGGSTELFVNYADWDSGTATGVTDAAMTFVEPTYTGQDGTAGLNWTYDAGLAHKLSNAATTFVYTRSATAAGNWVGISAAYKAGAGGGAASVISPAPSFMLLGVGV